MSTSTMSNGSSSAAPAQGLRSKAIGLASFVTGVVSFLAGFTLLVPLAGLIAGFIALRREPASKKFATWGIILNAVALVGGAIVAIGFIVVFWGSGLEAVFPN